MAADDLPGLQRVSPALCGVSASADPTQRPSQNHLQTASADSKAGESTTMETLPQKSDDLLFFPALPQTISPIVKIVSSESFTLFSLFLIFYPVGRCPPLRGFPLRWSTVGV